MARLANINFSSLTADYDKIVTQYSRLFLWTSLAFYAPFRRAKSVAARKVLEHAAGPFDAVPYPIVAAA